MAFASLLLSGLVVVLAPDVHVRGTELVLGALAEVRGDDAALVERAKALELGWAPAPGYTRVLQGWQIEQKISAAFAGTSIQLEGSRCCRIAPETSRVAGEDLAAKARAELTAVFGEREVALVAQSRTNDLEVPLGTKPVELRCAIERREQRAGAWSVPVQVWVDGALYQTCWIGFSAELYDLVPVLAHDVRRGEVIGNADIELRRTRISSDLGGEPLEAIALEGAVLLRDLGAGSVLVDKDVQRARLVRSGDVVQLQVRKGSITARGSAIAKVDGCAGDRIRVWNTDKTRELTGTVIARGLVEIELGSAP
ncbi:MAG: flagellar basal body P-ring formation protein FlgA [Planctomycetes bacterium]|nr:flagellar basal body P-ring formation protein FlgA [Planctomycetota bacterium]